MVIKYSIEECCECFLSDEKIRAGMLDFISFLRGLKMNPSWYHTDSYKCHFKRERVLYIRLKPNKVSIKVCTTEAVHNDNGKLNTYLQIIPLNIKNEFMKQIMYCDKINCRNHRNTCHGHDYKISGELYKNVCAESMYFRIANPTAEQFKLLEKFVLARIEYIKCPL